MKQIPESDRSAGSTPDRHRIDFGSELDSGSDSGLNPSRIQPDSIGVNRIRSESTGFDRSAPDSIGVLRSAPDSIGVLRSSGVVSGILSDSESVFNMWIRSGFVNPLRSSHH
uniref:Uncharacterized protein n=1 Tax=Anopheles maculatus TaxID=74869 RepID=A0A182S6C8_9DIPT